MSKTATNNIVLCLLLCYCCSAAVAAVAVGNAASPDAQPTPAATTSSADKKATPNPHIPAQNQKVHGAAPPSYPAVLKGKGRHRPPAGQRGAPPPVPPRGSPRTQNKGSASVDIGSRGEGSTMSFALCSSSPTPSWASESSGRSSHILSVEIDSSCSASHFHCMSINKTEPQRERDCHISLLEKHVACHMSESNDVLEANVSSSSSLNVSPVCSMTVVPSASKMGPLFSFNSIQCTQSNAEAPPFLRNVDNRLSIRDTVGKRNGMRTFRNRIQAVMSGWERICSVSNIFVSKQRTTSYSCENLKFRNWQCKKTFLRNNYTSSSEVFSHSSVGKRSLPDFSSEISVAIGATILPLKKGPRMKKRQAPVPSVRNCSDQMALNQEDPSDLGNSSRDDVKVYSPISVPGETASSSQLFYHESALDDLDMSGDQSKVCGQDEIHINCKTAVLQNSLDCVDQQSHCLATTPIVPAVCFYMVPEDGEVNPH